MSMHSKKTQPNRTPNKPTKSKAKAGKVKKSGQSVMSGKKSYPKTKSRMKKGY